jgi:hypothetical protein
MYWTMCLAIKATRGKGHVVFQDRGPKETMAANQPTHLGTSLVRTTNAKMNFTHDPLSF